MTEIIDNTLQFFATSGCAIWACTLASRKRSQAYGIVACFYGAFALGSLYWLVYLIVMTYTPKIFYVSDLSWIASFLFLLILELLLRTPEEINYKPPVAWLVPIIGGALTIYFLTFGDYVMTILWSGLTAACGYYAVRGLLFARKQADSRRNMQYFYFVILFITIAEYSLWLISCFWISDTLSNPYFWCDFALTGGLLCLIPAMKKGVLI